MLFGFAPAGGSRRAEHLLMERVGIWRRLRDAKGPESFRPLQLDEAELDRRRGTARGGRARGGRQAAPATGSPSWIGSGRPCLCLRHSWPAADEFMCRNFNWYPIIVDDVPTYYIYVEKLYLKEPERYGNVFIQKYGITRLSDLEIIDMIVSLKKKISAKIDTTTVSRITRGFDYTVVMKVPQNNCILVTIMPTKETLRIQQPLSLILTLMKKGIDISAMPTDVSWMRIVITLRMHPN